MRPPRHARAGVRDPDPGRYGRRRAAAKILNRHGADVVRIQLPGEVLLLVANRKDLSYDEHPFFGLIVRDLQAAGIDVRAASLP